MTQFLNPIRRVRDLARRPKARKGPAARGPLWPYLSLTLALVLISTPTARADGGHIALHASAGAYSITLFTAPEPLVAGPIDLSLLVEDATTGQVLGDAAAEATLATPNDPQPLHFSLTRAAASNKLLLAALPRLPRPGAYTLILHVTSPGASSASFTTVLPVAADHRRRTTLLFALVLPLVAIFLFLSNQQAKQSRGPRQTSDLH